MKEVAIRIGVFEMGEEDQRALMRGVLLREVVRLEGVVGMMKGLGGGEEEEEEKVWGSWYKMMGVKMEGDVQDTIRLIKEFGVAMDGTGTGTSIDDQTDNGN